MRYRTKTFKSEYIQGAKVKVEKQSIGVKLTYGSGEIYRLPYRKPFERDIDCSILANLQNNMSCYYADKIYNFIEIDK